MKNIFTTLVLLLTIFSCKENVADNESQKDEHISTMKGSKQDSQADLNLSAEDQLILLNKEMDSVLNAIYSEYSENKEFIKKLKISQDLWLKFHVAEMLARYPENDELREGSAFDLCWFSHKIQLKKQRLENLRVWLIGEHEGEICCGSVKVKNN